MDIDSVTTIVDDSSPSTGMLLNKVLGSSDDIIRFVSNYQANQDPQQSPAKARLEKVASQAWMRHVPELGEESRELIRTFRSKPDLLAQKMNKMYPPEVAPPRDYSSIGARHLVGALDPHGRKSYRGLEAGNEGIKNSLKERYNMKHFDDRITTVPAFQDTYRTNPSANGKDILITNPNPKKNEFVENASKAVRDMFAHSNPIGGKYERNYNGIDRHHEYTEAESIVKRLNKDGPEFSRAVPDALNMGGESHFSRKVLDVESRNLFFQPKEVRDAYIEKRTNTIWPQVAPDTHPAMYDIPEYGNTGVINKAKNKINDERRYQAMRDLQTNLDESAPHYMKAMKKFPKNTSVVRALEEKGSDSRWSPYVKHNIRVQKGIAKDDVDKLNQTLLDFKAKKFKDYLD